MATVQKGTASFRPKARLIRLLGDELISDEVMAVVELVKNAYDADASEVVVAVEYLDDPELAHVEVRDNGSGMTLDTLLHAWLEPATDHKRRHGRKRRTPLGRYPLGEKGVGRFAAAKLGEELRLVTRAADAAGEIHLSVQWEEYGASGYLDEVVNSWEVRDPLFFPSDAHGTQVRAVRPREGWDVARITKLRDGLARLMSPFSHRRDFSIELRCSAHPELSGPVTGTLLEGAPYRLAGRVDAGGWLDAEGQDGAVDLRARALEWFLEDGRLRDPVCGPFRLAYYVWDLGVGGHHVPVERPVRAALRRSSGVSLYRDGFRVWPYGSPGDDWLELNQRRVNNPTLRVSTNQIVGVVEITQTENPDLRDRTSREGLIDAPALQDLRALLVAALGVLEERRFAARQDAIASLPVEEEPDPVLRLMRQARARARDGEGTAALLDGTMSAYRAQLRERDDREERLMRIADVGMAAEQIAAQIGRTVATAAHAMRFSRHLAGLSGAPEPLDGSLEQVEANLALLEHQLGVVELLYDRSGGPAAERVEVRRVVEHAATIYYYALRRAGITLRIESPAGLEVKMPLVHLLQIVMHLLENAVHWLTRTPLDRPPEILVRLQADPPELLFADNGPGVPAEYRHLIFRPFFTGRDGRGLGLHVVQNLMERNGFRAELVEAAGPLSGACFRLGFAGS